MYLKKMQFYFFRYNCHSVLNKDTRQRDAFRLPLATVF